MYLCNQCLYQYVIIIMIGRDYTDEYRYWSEVISFMVNHVHYKEHYSDKGIIYF